MWQNCRRETVSSFTILGQFLSQALQDRIRQAEVNKIFEENLNRKSVHAEHIGIFT